MIASALAFQGGISLHDAVSKLPVPQIHSANETRACKLSVRVLAASIPGLGEPGMMSSKRPFLVASLGSCIKQTELADFNTGKRTGFVGTSMQECPWSFVDTLTLSVTLQDVLGPGLQLQLRVRNDFVMGPLRIDFQDGDIGVAAKSLREYVMPACAQRKNQESRWDSPVMIVPFSHVHGGVCGAHHELGAPVAHVALQFQVDMDPESVLRSANMASHMALAGRFESSFDDLSIDLTCGAKLPNVNWFPEPMKPIDGNAAAARADMRAWTITEPEKPLQSPELHPEGWVSHKGPQGQVYWHHRALGPAPWELASGVASSGNGLPSPEEAPSDWACHRCPFTGRTFWHHEALGPAPWLAPRNQADEESYVITV